MNHVRYQLACVLVWALLLVLGPVQVAHAQGTATVDQYCFNNNGGSCQGTWKNTASEACAEGAAYYTAQSAGIGQTCTVSACSGKGDTPANRFACTLTEGYVYNNGLSYRSSAGTLPCPSAGTKSVRDFTLGYSNSPNDGAPTVPEIAAYNAIRSSSRCVVAGGSSCAVTVSDQANMAYASTQPTSTGLYRISADFEVTYSGAGCTASSTDSAATNAAQPVPSCPGAFGTVNGKPTCVPTTAGTTASAPTRTDGTPVPVVTGNPAAGSNGADPLGNRVPTSGTNGANNGSPVTGADGVPVGWGRGVPATAGTTSGASGGSSLKAEDIQTDCDKKPNSIGCQEFGSAESGTLTTTNVALDTTPTPFASASGCPAPLTFSVMAATYTVSYQPLCDRLYALRVLFLLSASFIAAYIIANGFKS